MDDLTARLQPHHLAMLREESAISDEVILARGYRTVTQPGELADLGFTEAQRLAPGLLLPLHPTDGSAPTLYIYRPDNPRAVASKDGARRILKYEAPKGSGTRVDCPPACQAQIGDPNVDLWITEGQKKADSLASRGLCAIALLGVWNWKGRNAQGGTTLLADWDYVALKGRRAHIVYDSDVMTKPQVQMAMRRLVEHLQRKGATVDTIYLPQTNGHKVGVDDYFSAGHSLADLEGLIETPRPTPQVAAPGIEILAEAPLVVRRPMTLHPDHAYAATWLYVKKTITEKQDASGQIILLPEPEVIHAQELYVLRDDGVLYGPGADHELDELGVEVHLPEIPQAHKLWSKMGVMRYRAGQHPDPLDVFDRVVRTIDTFIDFSRSLSDQRSMAELVACYVLHTYLLDAFQVTSFLWPNGDRGAGKTQTISLITDMAYLGQMVLSGGSFAALRDLADYGACIAFDDAEGLSDPKKADPDKRALLLAGNRRGAVVPLKELTAEKTWRTRYVDAFCPRCFSAIRIPDAVLASRTIVIPLIRTGDRAKANRDPNETSHWPCDWKQLRDDLWAFGLKHIGVVHRYAEEVNGAASLLGRNLEPWRPILTVARMLDALDTEGRLMRDVTTIDAEGNETTRQLSLFGRMEAISVGYQTERPELEMSDLTVLALKAVANVAKVANVANDREVVVFTSVALREAFDALAEEEEMDVEWMGQERARSQRLGHVLNRLRFTRLSHKHGSRQWTITVGELRSHLSAYAMDTSFLEKAPSKTLATLAPLATLATPQQGELSDIEDEPLPDADPDVMEVF
jgi:hypothetical protein